MKRKQTYDDSSAASNRLNVGDKQTIGWTNTTREFNSHPLNSATITIITIITIIVIIIVIIIITSSSTSKSHPLSSWALKPSQKFSSGSHNCSIHSCRACREFLFRKSYFLVTRVAFQVEIELFFFSFLTTTKTFHLDSLFASLFVKCDQRLVVVLLLSAAPLHHQPLPKDHFYLVVVDGFNMIWYDPHF